MSIAKTPQPPYYAVIFTSVKTAQGAGEDYAITADRMVELAQGQPGFLGIESARNEIGITVSYWSDLESIRNWKMNSEHVIAQQEGRKKWYQEYKTRVCKVERDYGFSEI